MAEKVWGRPEQLVYPLGAGIATLYEEEHISSPILREVAFSMWNQCMKFYEEGLAEPQHDFKNLDEFIEFMKKTGVPEEIRGSQEQLAKVLGAGIAYLFEKEDVHSPLLRKVVHSIRRGCDQVLREGAPRERMGPPPFRAATIEELDQFLETARKMREPDEPETAPKRWRVIERHGDTIVWRVEAPKNEAGKYICGCMLVRGGVLTTSTQLFKICTVCDVGVLKNLVESLVKHPVVAEQIDGPATREGADSCYARLYLTPAVGK